MSYKITKDSQPMFSQLKDVAPDTILSISAAYQEDARRQKIDLGVGVYRNELGHTPIMTAVSLAMKQLAYEQETKVYVGLAGNPLFNQAILKLVFGVNHSVLINKTAVALQTPGGSGALRLIADLIARAKPNTTVWMSTPSYANHEPIMKAAGLNVQFYPYFDYDTKQINSSAMMACLQTLGTDDIVLVHGCCHNPTGTELTFEQWQQFTEIALDRGFVPFIDVAYQGLSQNWQKDGQGVAWLVDQLPEVLLSISCSKNFGLYRERTGAVIVVAKNKAHLQLAHKHLLKIARTTYTMPPDHGAAIVAKILNEPELYQLWQDELAQMSLRLRELRTMLVTKLNEYGAKGRFDFITDHCGMFSIIGLTSEQVDILRSQYAIYMVNDSRINIASLNTAQVDYLAQSIMDVVHSQYLSGHVLNCLDK